MKKLHTGLIMAALATLATTASAQIFKCESHDGKISFSEVPCSPDAGSAEYVGEIRKGTAESSRVVMDRMLRATDIMREDNSPGSTVTVVPDSTQPNNRRSLSPATPYPGNADTPYPPEINTREVEFDPRQSALDRRIEQVRNKVNDPRPQDGSSAACSDGRPSRGIVEFRGEDIWPGMTQAEIRRKIGRPRNINSVLVGQEQWTYDDPNGGTLVVMINGLCVSSIR